MLDSLQTLIRTHDYERYLCTLFAPAPVRPALWAVLALAYELFRIPATVSEEMVGLVRLKWWQERLSALALGADVGGEHPTLSHVAPCVQSGNLPAQLLEAMIEALAEQLHNPSDSAPIRQTMRTLYRLLAHAAQEVTLAEAYAEAGDVQAHIAMLRSSLARGEDESRIHTLLKAMHTLPTPAPTPSRLLSRLQRLNHLWIRRLSISQTPHPQRISPIPFLAMKLLR